LNPEGVLIAYVPPYVDTLSKKSLIFIFIKFRLIY